MKVIYYPEKKCWRELSVRAAKRPRELLPVVEEIFSAVEQEGDTALIRYTKKFDGIDLSSLRVDAHEIAKLAELTPEELKTAIRIARSNIERFHEAQKTTSITVETFPGITCSRKVVPIERVGMYVPGGTAPLFSTALMLGIPARIAGCKEIVLVTPPTQGGAIAPSIAYVAQELGITEVYAVGGAQAIALLTVGTESVAPVDKIFGPGNAYVTAAKLAAALRGVAIDIPAGPSEVLIVCDDSANPSYVAADLLSQAEHGKDSQVIVVTNSESILEKVLIELDVQLKALPREAFATSSLDKSLGIVFNSIEEGIAFSNVYAPEHVIVAVSNPRQYQDAITAAGSVFLGVNTPESFGDYASGTNHVLPTAGAARGWSGVSLESFQKRITFQTATREGLEALGPTVITMAEAEGLSAHARAVSIRLKR